jgi:3-oxoacyl-(acyl-carrier-protein) synthase
VLDGGKIPQPGRPGRSEGKFLKPEIWIGPVCQIAGNPSEAELNWLRQRKFLKVMDVHARRTLLAVREVLKGRKGDLCGENCGVIVSLEFVDSGEGDWKEAERALMEKSGSEHPSEYEIGSGLPPLALIPRLPNTIAGHIAREFGATGACWTSGSEGPAGLDALVQGMHWIEDGECNSVIVARIETEGTMAVILERESREESARKIVSWTMEIPGKSEAPESLELKNLEDWKAWRNAPILRGCHGEAGVRLNLEPA